MVDEDDMSAAASILADQESIQSSSSSSQAAKGCRRRIAGFSCFECGADPSSVLEPHVMMTPLGDNVIIIGAGAIGGFLGCCLYQGNKTVGLKFLVREDRYHTTGLRARSRMDPDFEASIPAEEIESLFTTDPSCLGEATCVFVATKRTSNEKVHRLLCQYQVRCPVIFLQSGIRIRDDLMDPVKIGKPLVSYYESIEAVVVMTVDLDKKTGTCTLGQPLKDALIVLDGKQPQQQNQKSISSDVSPIDEICQLFDPCAVTVYAEKRHDIISLQAAKLQLNMIDAVNALTGLTIANTLQQRGYRLVLAPCMDECRAVFSAHRIPIQAVGTEMSNTRLQFMPTMLRSWDILFFYIMGSKLKFLQSKSSMAHDLENALPKTEVEYINGAVVQLGYESGVPTPINTRILELIQRTESLQSGSPYLSPQDLLIQLEMAQPQLLPGRLHQAVEPPALMSYDSTIQEEIGLENTNSSSGSTTTGTGTQYNGETEYSLRHRVSEMIGMTVLSSETTMLPYINTPPMSPTTTVGNPSESVLSPAGDTNATMLSPIPAASTTMEMAQEYVLSFDRSVRIWG